MLLPPKRARLHCGVTKSTFYRWLRDEELGFPQPRIVKGRRFWIDAELDQWMSALPMEHRA